MTVLIPYPGSPGGAYKAYREHMDAISKPAYDAATGASYDPATRRRSRRRPKPESVAKLINRTEKYEMDRTRFALIRMGVSRTRAIIRETAAEFGLTHAELVSTRRSGYLIVPRFVAAWLAKKHTSLSFSRISREFGKRDHTTIMHAIQRADALIAGSQELAGRVAAIEGRLG